MPRPGPRPYECVKKAWHSERHQPMRGSIIQQIFRVVNKTHSTATRNNKEWQEKLPVVVLRAEEIMYSKANSEAEYLDSETVWDRLNDAVDTIIRRDESSETGELLPPCVEAALNLGCIPVRASRSQRHSNVRSYLSPRVHEPSPPPYRVSEKASNEGCSQLPLLHSSNQLNFARATTSTNSVIPVLESNHLTTRTGTITPLGSYPYLYGNVPSSGLIARKTNMGQQNNMQLNLGSVYPLYYGHQYQMDESQLNSQVPEKMNFNTLFVGKSVGRSVVEPAEVGVLQNFLSCSGDELASGSTTQTDLRDTHEKPHGREFDLSLRLSIVSDTCLNMERSLVRETVGIASSSSQDKSMYVDLLPQTNNSNEFCCFPGRGPNQPLESCSIKLFANKEDQMQQSESARHRSVTTQRMGNFGHQSNRISGL